MIIHDKELMDFFNFSKSYIIFIWVIKEYIL